MNLAEYYDVERVLQAEVDALARWCADHGRHGPAGAQPPAAQTSVAGVTLSAVAVADGVIATAAVVDLPATPAV